MFLILNFLDYKLHFWHVNTSSECQMFSRVQKSMLHVFITLSHVNFFKKVIISNRKTGVNVVALVNRF